jgi:nucleoid DNA-binding protein
MDELVKLVSQKAGITQQQAQTAVTTVLDFVKSKLPPQFASQIDGVVSGKTDLGGLGGMFGQK